MKLLVISSLILSAVSASSFVQNSVNEISKNPSNFRRSNRQDALFQKRSSRRSTHFWNVGSPRNLKESVKFPLFPEELMSETIIDSIDDKKNNAVNRLEETTTNLKRRKRRSPHEFQQRNLETNLLQKGVVKILAPAITRVSFGGTLNLECVINEDSPIIIWWWLNGTKLDLEHHRGGIYIESLKQPKSHISKLSLADFTHSDAGLYECRAEKEGFGTPPSRSSVQVTVVDPTQAPLFSDDCHDCEFSSATWKKDVHYFASSIVLTLMLILII